MGIHFDMRHLIFQTAKPQFVKTELLDMVFTSNFSYLLMLASEINSENFKLIFQRFMILQNGL